MNEASDKRRFTFELAGLEGDETVARVKRYLLWTFPGQSAHAVDRALARRPVRFSGVMTPENAERLRRQLESMGVRAALLEAAPGPPPPAAPAEAHPPGAPAAEGPAPAEGAPGEAAPEEPLPAVETAPPAVAEAAPPPPAPDAVPASLAELRAAIARDRVDPEDEGVRQAERIARARAAEERAGPPAFFWSAWAQALFTPRRFFASLRTPGGTLKALLFAAVLGLLAGILSFPARMLAGFEQGTISKGELVERYLTTVFTQPLVAVLATLVTAWLFHMGLRFLAGPRPFEVTLKVVAYTSAAAVFAAIPNAGEPIAGFVALLLTLVGLSSAQRVTPIKALGAVLFPLLLLGFALAMAIGSIALGSFIILEALRV